MYGGNVKLQIGDDDLSWWDYDQVCNLGCMQRDTKEIFMAAPIRQFDDSLIMQSKKPVRHQTLMRTPGPFCIRLRVS